MADRLMAERDGQHRQSRCRGDDDLVFAYRCSAGRWIVRGC